MGGARHLRQSAACGRLTGETVRDAQRYEEMPLTAEELSIAAAVNWASAPAW